VKESENKIKNNRSHEFSSLEEARNIIDELLQDKTVLLGKIRSLMIRLEQSERMQQSSSMKLMYDGISGLPNHFKMDKDIGTLLWDFFQLPEPPRISLLLIKLDKNFNHIRQAFTTEVFENILYTISNRLKEMLDQRGLLYHPRLDEFAIYIFDSLPDEQLQNLVREITENIETTIDNQVYKVKVGCHIGIASFPEDGLNKRMLLSNADIALSQALISETAMVFFNDEMRRDVMGNLEMQDGLLSAIEVKTILELSDNFTLFFQPILTVGKINPEGLDCTEIKAEVLIRWKDPNRGTVLPRNLIEVAEETGLILPIGRWLLKASMMKLSEWQKVYSSLKLSINISPRQFFSDSFSGELKELVERAGVDPHDIFLEITESCLFNDQELASEEIKVLHEIGFNISLDDFGTGYSSLGYLDRFHADVLKIDRIFTDGLDEEGKKRDIIKSIVRIGQELDMEVVFEGIETKNQLEKAYELGCRTFQGFLISHPLPVEDFQEFLENTKDKFIAFPD